MDMVTVPLLPPAQRQRTLHMCHDVPSAGHQGIATNVTNYITCKSDFV